MPKLIVDESWMIKTISKTLNDMMDLHITVDRFEFDSAHMGKKQFSISYTENLNDEIKLEGK